MATMNATADEAAMIVAAGRVTTTTDGGFDRWVDVYVDGIRIRSDAWHKAFIDAMLDSGRPVSDFVRS